MSLTLKLSSLAIRTVAKPIGNLIKRQAREHDGFRQFCVRFAQGLHRWDARMRLGLLEDSEAITRQIEREAASAEARRLRAQNRPPSTIPTVKTAQQTRADEEARLRERRFIEGKVKNDEKKKEAKMFKPLSESKAIDTGANFASEAFVFMIGVGLLVFENWRSRRKDATRREDVQDRLESLEEQIKESQGEKSSLEQHIQSLIKEMEQMKTTNTSKSQASVDGAASDIHDSRNTTTSKGGDTPKGEGQVPQNAQTKES